MKNKTCNPLKETPKIFEGFWLATAKILTLMCIIFSLIIQNVSLLPTIQNSKIRFVFFIVSIFLAISLVYFSLKYSLTEGNKLKSEDCKLKKEIKEKVLLNWKGQNEFVDWIEKSKEKNMSPNNTKTKHL